ncbi:Ionotropic receptor 131 [Hyalella azteca]|uniref:Ionotropic receptor 131 n=1 Tax=Hyalella azteca TaxID=294128 RepID=A0A6A0GYF6_HYAAZ|nr:Ionotropic receptor 131 [Hyalella azteca]
MQNVEIVRRRIRLASPNTKFAETRASKYERKAANARVEAGAGRHLGGRQQISLRLDCRGRWAGPIADHKAKEGSTSSVRSYTEHHVCRVLLVDASTVALELLALSILEKENVFRHPELVVIAFGGSASRARNFLMIPILGNTIHALYCAGTNSSDVGPVTEASVYRLCHYCRAGRDVLMVGVFQHGKLQQHADIFPDETKNFRGHQFNIVTMDWFPLITFTKNSSKVPGAVVTPDDSLDYRILTLFARNFNFTYVMRTPWDLTWGIMEASGNWTGTMGTLQHDAADFSMLLTWLRERFEVVDFTRVYVTEPLVTITLKAQVLPEIMSLSRPFSGTLWLLVVPSVFLFGLVLYLAYRTLASCSASDQETLQTLATATLISWQMFFQVNITLRPRNTTIRILVLSWWLFSLLVTIAYKSSLIAHLSVPGADRPIDTLEQVGLADSWTLGYETTSESGWWWLTQNKNPEIMRAAAKVKVMDLEKNIAAVLKGNHMFLTWKYYVSVILQDKYTDSRGHTPFHMSKREYNFGGYGWGFRRGAPFRRRMDTGIQRLVEAGLIRKWLDDLTQLRAKNGIATPAKDDGSSQSSENDGASNDLVVLGLGHLQASFYILVLGYVVASLVLFVEMTALKFPMMNLTARKRART